MKIKQQDVSSELLVTAIDVKCNFNLTNTCKSGENAKYCDRGPGGGTGNSIFQRPFSQNFDVRPELKFYYYRNSRKSTFLPSVGKNLSDRFIYLFLYTIIFFLAKRILKV